MGKNRIIKSVQKRRTQAERSDSARKKLINAAIKLIYERGYSNVTMQQIAGHAGLTRGAIQHHFNSRDALFVALIKYAENEWVKFFETVTHENNHSIEQRIDMLLDKLWDLIHKPIVFVLLDIRLGVRNDPTLLRVIKEAQQASTRLYINYWVETFSPAVPLEKINEACELVTSVLQGFTVTGIFGPGPGKIPASCKKTLVRTKELTRRLMLEA